MNIAVVGSRSFNDYELLRKELIGIIVKLPIDEEICIISGGARGADSLAEQFAKDQGYKTRIFYPEWDKYGRSAGIIRNRYIVEACDLLVAFWNGKSRGTNHSIGLARENNKKLKIVSI